MRKSNYLGFLLLLTLVVLSSCKKKINYHYVNGQLLSAFNFKPGTYWIYIDSVTGREDSFVVTNYGDYYSWYNTQYGTREINFSEINFDLTGKFYIIGTGVVQPYVGAGVGYNRTKMAYDQKQQSTYTGSYSPYSNVSFGEESYTGSFVSGILLAGTDVMFTDMLGLNFQFKYAKGLTSGTSTDQGILANPDQLFLNQLGQEIDKSGQVSITGGLNVAF